MVEVFPAADGLVRVYHADDAEAGLLWVHGGGFSGGSIDMPESDVLGQELAKRGVTFVSVDYRLADPTTHYPAPSDDVIAAWRWFVKAGPRLGLSSDKLCLGGGSAGGNLSAGAVLRLKETDTVPRLLVLAYPTLLAVQPRPSEYLQSILERDRARGCADLPSEELRLRALYETYLGMPVEDAPDEAVPAVVNARRLSAFPRTLIINDELDVLRVSSELFASRLIEAGIHVEIATSKGTHHGHLNRPDEPAFHRSLALIEARLKDAM